MKILNASNLWLLKIVENIGFVLEWSSFTRFFVIAKFGNFELDILLRIIEFSRKYLLFEFPNILKIS